MHNPGVIEVNISIHGPIEDRVLRLNTAIKLQEPARLSELLVSVGTQIGIELLTVLREGQEHPVILLNGEHVDLPAGLDHPLHDKDQVAILQAIAGG